MLVMQAQDLSSDPNTHVESQAQWRELDTVA